MKKIIFLALNLAINFLVAQVPQSERDALIALYNATDGANWTHNDNWNTSNPVGTWYGVTVENINGADHVTQLNLGWNNLNGTIPAEIGDLANLTSLNLGGNQLTGSIPHEIGNLTNLDHLFLNYNQLSGSIPPEIGNLINLTYLYLDHNQLSGSIPSEIGNLINLLRLKLHKNELSGTIPIELGNLANIYYLRLNNNQLTGPIPSELGNLSNLKWLYLYYNHLSGGIPDELGALSNLWGFFCNNNQLSGNVPNFSTNTHLRYFFIDHNDFSFADLEPHFSSIQNVIQSNGGRFRYSPMNPVDVELTYDVVYGNNYTFNMATVNGTGVTYQWYRNDTIIQGATSQTYNINNAQHEDLGDYVCRASSPVIPDLTIDRNVIHLYGPVVQQDRNALIGLYNATDGANWTHNDNWNTSQPVYNWYGVKVVGDRIIELNLSENNLNGTLPSSIGDMSELRKLDLSRNDGNLFPGNLHGNIPPEIGNLNKLEELKIEIANLSGNLPAEIGNLSNLKYLSLVNNQLNGAIPSEMGNLSSLEYLYLADNQFANQVPSNLANLTTLREIELQNNQLTGNIPANFFQNMSDLEEVRLNNNLIDGDVDFSHNASLRYIYVNDMLISSLDVRNGHNDVIWTLRATNNPNLTCIYVDDKNESQLSYWEIDSTTHFVETDAECEVVQERNALIALYNATDGANWTHNNNWNTSNPVGTWYGVTVENINGTDHVTRISLSWNHLSGNLPPEIGNLTYLKHLSLKYNTISGSVPSTLSGLSYLESVDLHGNHFSGTFPDLSGNTNLNRVYIYRNDFSFADLEPHFSSIQNVIQSNGGSFRYSPMNPVDVELSYDVVYGNNYTFTMPTVNGTGVTYQWYRNDTIIQGATSQTYNINNAQHSDLGDYVCKASSPVIPDLTIDRNVIHLYGPVVQQDRNALIDLYNSTDGPNWTHNDNWNTNAKVYDWYGIKVVGDRVTEIHLSNNNLNGTLPASIGNLTRLDKLILSRNGDSYSGDLHGSIPSEIGNLSSMKKLILSYNNLSGNIPSEIGNLSDLQYLDLYKNNLSGNIPSEITTLSNLKYLDLGMNNLSGNIPVGIGNLSNLEDLSFWHNQLTGAIPSEIGNLTELRTFSVEDNPLTGTIPASLANLTKMISFWIGNNQLSGDVPPGLFDNMPHLYWVAIYGNNVTGNIDLAHNPELNGLFFYDTHISTLDVRNGNNSNMSYFYAQNNPDLTCVFVDDQNASYLSHWHVDNTAHFVETQAECDAFDVNEIFTDSIIVYPNPFSENIFIEVQDASSIKDISIQNIAGQTVYSGRYRPQIDLSDLPAGIYFLHIKNHQNQEAIFKLIKQ